MAPYYLLLTSYFSEIIFPVQGGAGTDAVGDEAVKGQAGITVGVVDVVADKKGEVLIVGDRAAEVVGACHVGNVNGVVAVIVFQLDPVGFQYLFDLFFRQGLDAFAVTVGHAADGKFAELFREATPVGREIFSLPGR